MEKHTQTHTQESRAAKVEVLAREPRNGEEKRALLLGLNGDFWGLDGFLSN